jgi:hypothetical protein
MVRSSRSSPFRAPVAVAVAAFGATTITCVFAACVLADPPPDLPGETQLHPVVVKSAVFPPTAQVLVELPPSGFDVPVQIFDTDTAFEWQVFVDYDPLVATAPVIATKASPPFALDGGLDVVDFDLVPYFAALDPTVCHRIDFVVALAFEPSSLHTPDSRGGDGVSWFYDVAGGLGGCPELGASEPSTSDAASPDASDGGTGTEDM